MGLWLALFKWLAIGLFYIPPNFFQFIREPIFSLSDLPGFLVLRLIPDVVLELTKEKFIFERLAQQVIDQHGVKLACFYGGSLEGNKAFLDRLY